tara:strand:+ start:239 stop:2101 length:1863 start_codon:yes stop_codon:yes gene_type:complete
MLSFQNLSLRRGSNLLFTDVNFTIHKKNKVGLVGANGSGKSSLLKLIKKEIESDHGEMHLPPNLKIACLDQEIPSSEEIALDYVLEGDIDLREVVRAIKIAEENENYQILGDLHSKFEDLGGFSAKSRAEKLMIGLGFTENEFNKPLKDFSGGWRVRLNLARTLMQPSDLLLLDEPTNHLDLDTILWLENWIKSFQGILILISHDRDFLNSCVDQIAHIQNQKIELYTGNYSEFEIRKAAKLSEQKSNFDKQQREINHMQSFIKRFKAKATKARQAQSRIKALERMKLIAPAHIDSPFVFNIPESEKKSNPLLSLESAELGYEYSILSDVKISFRPGDRIGLLGANGVGKSTLIKSLNGVLSILKGNKREGKNLVVGYFSQHQVDDLELSASPIDHIRMLDSEVTEKEIRSFLGGYNFSGDKAKETIKEFSGGEKARLALAKIAFQKPNLLLLDEPTNHLDMDMRQALTVALQDFGGAILLVSHDRHLLANTVDEFFIIKGGKLEKFDGDLDDYRNLIIKGKLNLSLKSDTDEHKEIDKAQVKLLKSEISDVEKTLKRLQRKLSEAEAFLNSPHLYDQDKELNFHDVLRNQVNLTSEIELAENKWLEFNRKLDELVGLSR